MLDIFARKSKDFSQKSLYQSYSRKVFAAKKWRRKTASMFLDCAQQSLKPAFTPTRPIVPPLNPAKQLAEDS